MIENKEKMLEMKKNGMTYQQIGDVFGISKQRVYAIAGETAKHYHRHITKEQCVYDGLRGYLNENKISRMHFCRMCYEGIFHQATYHRFKKVLKGSNTTKQTIDRILEATGLSYEVAFERSNNNAE